MIVCCSSTTKCLSTKVKLNVVSDSLRLDTSFMTQSDDSANDVVGIVVLCRRNKGPRSKGLSTSLLYDIVNMLSALPVYHF